MKKYIYLIVLGLVTVGYSQQQEQYSMYMMNNFLVNPAEAGTEDFIDINLGYRSQWVDFGDGAPTDVFISGHAALNKEVTTNGTRELAFHGVGGAVIQDNIGPFNITNIKLAYAYHLPIYKHFFLSLGAFGGVKQYKYNSADVQWSSDASDVEPGFESDISKMTPDLSVGIWGYSKKFYFGYTSFQLIPASFVDAGVTSVETEAQLSAHHWATAGYNIMIDSAKHWNLVPSVVFKGVKGSRPSMDFNLKIKYNNLVWAGVSYRTQDAVIVIAGVTVKNMVDIGYAYDITTSNIKNSSSGSHEILLALRLPNHEHHPPQPQFW